MLKRFFYVKKFAAIWLPNGSFLPFASSYNKEMKHTKKQLHVTLQINARTYTEFARANREIARRTGAAPGAETLMAFMLRAKNDAHDLADIYCFKALRQSPELIAQYQRA